MKSENIFRELQFSEGWVDLGIVTSESLAEMKQEYETSDDKDSEHYRWRAFTRFLNTNKLLAPEIIKALYQLGESDPDETMGGAMMRELLDRKDCPMELLKVASRSDKDFIVIAANRAIERCAKKAVLTTVSTLQE